MDKKKSKRGKNGNNNNSSSSSSSAARDVPTAPSIGGAASSATKVEDGGGGGGLLPPPGATTPKRKDKKGNKKDRSNAKEAKPSPKSSPLLRRLSTFMKGQGRNKNNSKHGPSTPDRKGKKSKSAAAAATAAAAVVASSPSLSSPSSSAGSKKVKDCGHIFEQRDFTQPTWCDLCDQVIWGLFKQGVYCTKCTYTIHRSCQHSVVLDCAKAQRRSADLNGPVLASRMTSSILTLHPKAASATSKAGATASPQGLLSFFEPKEISSYIATFNAASEQHRMEPLESEDGKQFRGYIRVSLDVTRPIRVATDAAVFAKPSSPAPGDNSESGEDGTYPGSGHSQSSASSSSPTRSIRSGSGSQSSLGTEGQASFYLPKNVSKGLFVTSETTSQEVIGILLRKFKVISNPRKFALYETNTKELTKRRLRRFENPLVLQLLWGGDNKDFTLSLQEYHDESQVEFPWDDFSKPELEMFLRILDSEEAEAVSQVEKRYERKREKVEGAISAAKAAKAASKGSKKG